MSTDRNRLPSVVGAILKKRRKTLAVAESCTGGLLSHLTTQIPGSSDYFVGSIVAYSNKVKVSQIKVRASLLRRCGAVSKEAAESMAKNIRKIFKTDYGIAITGIAGPTGGYAAKPVGLVYLALADKKSVRSYRNQFSGSRTEIKGKAVRAALERLKFSLKNR